MVVAARTPPSVAGAARLLLSLAVLSGALPLASAGAAAAAPTHLLVSEVVTGGTSASDELVELYNPTASPISLDGLELIYVTASGATISRRAAWSSGAPAVPSGGHVLVANETGIYAPIADALYGSGIAATGGSVALRVTGATTAIDAVGWGTASSTWKEGEPAVAPAPGSSIERLPGGAAGSTTDTDDNGADFVERPVPSPQNLASSPTPDRSATPTPPTDPTPSPDPTPSVTPTPSFDATPLPSQTPQPTPASIVTIAAARAAPDGAQATVEGVALTDSDFHDGGGFVADATAGIAVIVDGGAFERGQRLRLTGTLDDRFSQRTLRADAAAVTVLGATGDPPSPAIETGAVGEAVEGSLVRLGGTLVSSGSALTSGTAFDLDDGSGATRVVVPAEAGIDLTGWVRHAHVSFVGVVSQRDSTGSGVGGYRVMPRDPADVTSVAPPASDTPSPSPSPSTEVPATPSPSALPDGVSTVAEARAAVKNARVRVRGVVTLPTGIVDGETAVIQDATAAIVLRLGDEAGSLQLGQHVEVAGTRSTKSGMETLRVAEPPSQLGTAAGPTPRTVRTGEAGESHEATLVVVRGALAASARRASSGAVSFEVDDGSGPLRVSVAAALAIDDEQLVAGTWVEVRGVLGQETTGAQPLRGYRIWPRTGGEVTIVAPAGGTVATGGGSPGGSAGSSTAGSGSGTIEASDAAGATLVLGPWREVGIGGVLWDGSRVLAIDAGSAELVTTALAGARPPIPVRLATPTVVGTERVTGAAMVSILGDAGGIAAAAGALSSPRGDLPTDDVPTWVSLIGRLHDARLQVGTASVEVDYRCDAVDHPTGLVAVVGVANGEAGRIVVPCNGIRRAPAVARLAVDHEVAPPAEPAMVTYGPSREASGRPLVAAALGVSALILIAGAAIARRLRIRPDDVPPDVGATADGESPEDDGRRLTLVRVTGDHGS